MPVQSQDFCLPVNLVSDKFKKMVILVYTGSICLAVTSSAISYGDAPLPDTRIEDGKLLFERRWYHRGQPVYVEGKDISTYPAIITAIGIESVRFVFRVVMPLC